MWINANTGAVTTFTEFDKVAFSSGTGTQLLQIYAPTLYLASNGCTFDGSTTYAVKLTGNGTGSGAGPRALFGNATCATNDATSGLCATSEKSDDDANNDGVPDHPTTNGAVVQFVRAAEADTDGTLVGFPTAAFDWNSFTYYSTYVAFHDASGGSDVIYVRDESGNPLYSWIDPTADETITGTPQWISTTVASVTTHYLYVSVNGGSSNSGKVYRLKDTGTGTTGGTLTLDASWATGGAYSCGCTITSDLSLDTNNVYWAATTGTTTQVLMGLAQSGGATISASWPVTTPSTSPPPRRRLSTVAGTTTLYLGVTGNLLQLAVTGTTFVQNTAPGTITGRVSFGTSFLAATMEPRVSTRATPSGTIWAISPTNFTGTNFLWSYAAGGAITNNYYDGATDTLAFGTSGGNVVVLNAAGSGTGGSLLNTSYPYTLDASDPITAAPLYVNGVLAVGTTLGKLYFLDRNTGTRLAQRRVDPPEVQLRPDGVGLEHRVRRQRQPLHGLDLLGRERRPHLLLRRRRRPDAHLPMITDECPATRLERPPAPPEREPPRSSRPRLSLAAPARADDWATLGSRRHRAAGCRPSDRAPHSRTAGGPSLRPSDAGALASPVVADGFVVSAGLDGSLTALAADTGQLVWQVALGAAVQATPAIANGRVFVPTLGSKIVALGLADGKQLWSTDLGGLNVSSPAIVNGDVVVGAGLPQQFVVRLDGTTGAIVWQTPPGMEEFSNTPPAVGGGLVVVGTQRRPLLRLRRGDRPSALGLPRRRRSSTSPRRSSPAGASTWRAASRATTCTRSTRRRAWRSRAGRSACRRPIPIWPGRRSIAAGRCPRLPRRAASSRSRRGSTTRSTPTGTACRITTSRASG